MSNTGAITEFRNVEARSSAELQGLAVLNSQGELIYANEPCAILYGFSSAQNLLGKNWQTLVHPSDHASLQSKVFNQISSLESWHGETIGRKSDGKIFHKELTVSKFNDGAIIAVRDITSTKLAVEAQAEAYENSQKAIMARNDFVAMVSHDLKNPLSAILLNTAYMLRGFKRDPQITEKERLLQKQVETLERSAQRMKSLISDFLDLARIESGKLAVECSHHRVQTLINETLEIMSPLAAEKSIELTRNAEPLTQTVYLDRERIFQVLSNLIGNAIKFTPSGGRIHLGVYLDHGEIVFVVQDTGPGIPSHQRPHVFDRYWQAKENNRGSAGIGLSICKGIVEAHGGKIWVESAPGEGTTFYFSLPHPVA